MRYSTVLLDADMTLLDFDADEAAALSDALRDFGIICTEEIRSLYHNINKGLWEEYELGIITKQQIGENRFTRLLEALGAEGDGVELNKIYMGYLCNGGRTLDGAHNICRKLSESGAKLYIITNGTTHIQKSRFSRSGLEKYIDGVFISDEIGFQKPKKEYFDAVFKSIDEADKSRIIVVGDSPSSDIAGGINTGLDTCRFNPKRLPDGKYTPTYTVHELSEIFGIVMGE